MASPKSKLHVGEYLSWQISFTWHAGYDGSAWQDPGCACAFLSDLWDQPFSHIMQSSVTHNGSTQGKVREEGAAREGEQEGRKLEEVRQRSPRCGFP